MAEIQLIPYSYVWKFWKEQKGSKGSKGSKNEDLTKKIEAFFAPSYFFCQHATLEFFLGINGDTRNLLLSMKSIKSIHTELEIFTSSTLPMITTAQSNSYKNVEAIYIDSPSAYNKINKEIQKYNKKIRTYNKLRDMKFKWEKAQSMLKEKKYFFVAVDVESYERDHSCVLEVGWSMFDSKTESFMDRHFCVEEYRHLRNGQFVPDRKDRFIFGETVWAKLNKICSEIVKDLTEETEKGRVVFVGHNVRMDVKYLEDMNVKVKEVINPVEYFDTAEMNAARLEKPNERLNLGRLLDELDIENYCLHNAGNDAHYTLCLFLELCKLPLQPPEDATASQPASSSD